MVDYFVHAKDVLIGPWSGATDLAQSNAIVQDENEREMDDLTD
jgi:hypothetical protein